MPGRKKVLTFRRKEQRRAKILCDEQFQKEMKAKKDVFWFMLRELTEVGDACPAWCKKKCIQKMMLNLVSHLNEL
jgi:hypothetical protein